MSGHKGNPYYFQGQKSPGYNAHESKSHETVPIRRVMPETLLVLTNLPDAESARNLAKGLVGMRLAACVNVLAPCLSFYTWQGAPREDGEVPLLIKTTAQLYPDVQSYIKQQHPYELPEIIAMEITSGLPDYLRWVADTLSTSTPA